MNKIINLDNFVLKFIREYFINFKERVQLMSLI